jgi:hypothetical protein
MKEKKNTKQSNQSSEKQAKRVSRADCQRATHTGIKITGHGEKRVCSDPKRSFIPDSLDELRRLDRDVPIVEHPCVSLSPD